MQIFIKLLLLCFVFLISTSVISASVLESNLIFTDVNEDDFAYSAIKYLVDEGIVKGYEDGSFKPSSKINRAEFLKIVLEAAKKDEKITDEIMGSNCFPDVQDQWFSPYVCTAHDLGIIDGYPDGKFYPEKEINFVEASKIISNAFHFFVNTETYDENWYQPFIFALADKNAIPSSITGFEHPLSRADMACMVSGIIDKSSCGSLSYEKIKGVSFLKDPIPLFPNSYSNIEFYKVKDEVYIVDFDGSVYHLAGANPDKFKKITGSLYVDNQYVFIIETPDNSSVKASYISEFDFDLSTFEFLVEGNFSHYKFFKDDADLYFSCYDSAPDSLISIDDFDPDNFGIIYDDQFYSYFTDSETLYVARDSIGSKNEESCKVKKAEDVDVNSFEILTGGYSKDKNNVYYIGQDDEFSAVNGVIDVGSFGPAYLAEYALSDYFQDDTNVYIPEGDHMSVLQPLSNEAETALTTYDTASKVTDVVRLGSEMGVIFEDDGNYLQIDGKKYSLHSEYEDFISSEDTWGVVTTQYQYDENLDFKYALINGVEYGPYKRVDSLYISDNNWVFSFEKDGDNYVNINGKEYGPYGVWENQVFASNTHWGFMYGVDNTKINKGKEYSDPIEAFLESVKMYFRINGQDYGPYDLGQTFLAKIKDDSWGFVYIKDMQAYVKIKDKEFGPYEYVDALEVSEDGWIFNYNHHYLNINGKTYGPYSEVPDFWDYQTTDQFEQLSMNSKNNWGFVFRDEEKVFVNINETIYGPYDFAGVSVTDNNWVIRSEIDNKTYVNISGTEYGPYDLDSVEVVKFSEDNFAFKFSKKYGDYLNLNGDEIGPYNFCNKNNFYYKNNDFALSYYLHGHCYIKTNNPSLFKNYDFKLMKFLDPSLNIPIPEPELG